MQLDRRELAAALFAALQGPAAAETPRKTGHRVFREVAASLYAWDLADEGTDAVLDTLRETAKVNSVYLVALMHHEKRPLTDFYFPHNPKRRTYFPEDSRTYWHPHEGFYGRIKPRPTEREEFRNTDWLVELVKSARRKGMKVGAEISHTVLDKERARGEQRDALQQDIWGNRLGQLVCHNNPDVREYVNGLFRDLAASYELDYVQTCMLPFAQTRLPVMLGNGDSQHAPNTFEFGFWGGLPDDLREALAATAQGACFCQHCHDAAKQQGLDLKAIRKALLPVAEAADHPNHAEAHRERLERESGLSPIALLLEHPAIFDLIRFRCLSMTNAYSEIRAAMVRERPQIDFRENAHLPRFMEFAGLHYGQLRPSLGSIR